LYVLLIIITTTTTTTNNNNTYRTVSLGEDEAEEAELNPFSFREFIRHHGPDPDSEGPTRDKVRTKRHNTLTKYYSESIRTPIPAFSDCILL